MGYLKKFFEWLDNDVRKPLIQWLAPSIGESNIDTAAMFLMTQEEREVYLKNLGQRSR